MQWPSKKPRRKVTEESKQFDLEQKQKDPWEVGENKNQLIQVVCGILLCHPHQTNVPANVPFNTAFTFYRCTSQFLHEENFS